MKWPIFRRFFAWPACCSRADEASAAEQSLRVLEVMSVEDKVPDHVSDNIEAMLALRAKSERRLRRGQRAIEALTSSVGQPSTLYVLLAGVALWIAYNYSVAQSGARPVDAPPFFWLQGLVALYAALMTTMILTTQNRQSKDAERNAHLELQVNLLVEQRTAKLIALLEELRRDLPNVRNRVDPLADALQEAVPATAVSTALEQTLNASANSRSTAVRESSPPST